MSETRDAKLDQLAVNTIKFLAIDGVEKAKSGHPGLPMGAADYAFVLWNRYLRYNPKDPKWPNRDRFVLSGGHGSMLLYSLLHLAVSWTEASKPQPGHSARALATLLAWLWLSNEWLLSSTNRDTTYSIIVSS
jgi:hypothetical protein